MKNLNLARRRGASRTVRTGFAALVAVALPLLSACSEKDTVYTGHFHAFGGLVDVTIVSVPVEKAQDAVNALEKDFAFMEENWNPGPGAPLARVNDLLAKGERFAAPPCILPLIERGQELSERSEGLLNPAIGGLFDLWGFYDHDAQAFRPPEPEAIADRIVNSPALNDVTVDDFFISSSNPAVRLDFSGFMKGYALDQAARHLQELGIENAMINVGGDLHVTGSRAGHPWHVAVRRPNGTGVLATMDIRGDESVFTVGAFEEYRTWRGTHYHHILDPRSGWPADESRSVTVIHPDATLAHAAATALFIAGPDDWPRIAARMGVDQVVMTDAQGVLHISPKAEARLRFLQKPSELRVQDPKQYQDAG